MVELESGNGRILVQEIRKALAGPAESLEKSLSTVHASADEVLSAVTECVEEEKGDKKKKSEGELRLDHLLHRKFKRFLTEHVALLGVEGALKTVAVIEKKMMEEQEIEDEYRQKIRVYGHLLAHLLSEGANVLGYERLREAVKETLARAVEHLRNKGIQDASNALARVVLYVVLSERDYLEGGEQVVEKWWSESIHKKLRKEAYLAVLTSLIERERKTIKEWVQVDFDAVEQEKVTGAIGVLTARWIFVDTVVCHAPSLAARCPATVYARLVEIAVRAYIERGELIQLVDRLASVPDASSGTWTTVVVEAMRAIQNVFESCRERRERVTVHQGEVREAETSYGKHRVGCGCSGPVSLVLRGLSAVPHTLIDEDTIGRLELFVLQTLSAFEVEEEAPLREIAGALKWMVERTTRVGAMEWPEGGVQMLRGLKAMRMRNKGETRVRDLLTGLSRGILMSYGHTMGYKERVFLDAGHVVSRVMAGEMSVQEVDGMKANGAAKSIDKMAKYLLKWAHAMKNKGEEENEQKEIEMLTSWWQQLLPASAAYGLSTVVLLTVASLNVEKKEKLLSRVWKDKEEVQKMVDSCISLLLQSTPPDETYERDRDTHSTTIRDENAPVDSYLARAVCLFLLNCTPYLSLKVSPAELARWERLTAMHADCASIVLARTKPDAIQALFAQLPEWFEAMTPELKVAQPEKVQEEKAVGDDEEEVKRKGGNRNGELPKKRKSVEKAVDAASTAACLKFARLAAAAAAAMSERAAVLPESAAAAVAAAAVCLAAAAPTAVAAAAELAAAGFYELATRCVEVYGEAAGGSGLLAVSLATAATRPPPSTDYERSRRELLLHSRLLATTARSCKQSLLRDQVSLYSTLLARVLHATAAHAERTRGLKCNDGAADPTAAKRRKRDEERTLHAAAKAANAVNEESHFARVIPFVLADCLLPLRTASSAIQYPAVLLSHAIDRYGRSFLATCLPPAERLAYTRMFPTFKEMNRRVV